MSKKRLSASVDDDLLDAAGRAVARGRAKTLSAWVNDALRLKVEHDRQQDALARFVAAYEDAEGEITEEETRLAVRRARSRTVSGGAPAQRRKARRSKRRGGA